MGTFYSNITLKGPSQKAVADALHGRLAIVSPEIGPYTVVYDSVCDHQDDVGIQALTSRLTAALRCTALAVIVHDDDILIFYLYNAGTLLDSYNSNPSYFDFGSTKEPAGPSGGCAELLCAAFADGRSQEVNRVLHNRPAYAFESDRHRDLVRALSLPDLAVGVALASFEGGEIPRGLSIEKMLRAEPPPPVEDPQLRRDREFYDRLSPEDPAHACKRPGCLRGAISSSLLCRRHQFEMVHGRNCPFDH